MRIYRSKSPLSPRASAINLSIIGESPNNSEHRTSRQLPQAVVLSQTELYYPTLRFHGLSSIAESPITFYLPQGMTLRKIHKLATYFSGLFTPREVVQYRRSLIVWEQGSTPAFLGLKPSVLRTYPRLSPP